jgi:hypothetical protein
LGPKVAGTRLKLVEVAWALETDGKQHVAMVSATVLTSRNGL